MGSLRVKQDGAGLIVKSSSTVTWPGDGLNGNRVSRGLCISATALGTVLVGLFAVSAPAVAGCTPAPTAGPDTITCAGSPNGVLDALGGDDAITYQSGDGTIVRGNTGNDTIIVDGGFIEGVFNPVNSGFSAVQGNDGDDTIYLNGGVIGSPGTNTDVAGDQGDISAPGGNDTIILNGATVHGAVRTDGGSENWITLTSGSILGGNISGVIGSNQVDYITANPGAGQTLLIQEAINAAAGNDVITLSGGMIGAIDGREGSDTIVLQGSLISRPHLGVNRGSFVAGTGDDTIHLLSGTVEGNVLGDFDGASPDDGDDQITLNGATITGFIRGRAGADTITLLSGTVGQQVLGDEGSDTIDIGDGTNPSAAGPSIISAVRGGTDADAITLHNGTVGGSVTGDAGEDTISLLGGSAGNVDGGDDSDQITLTGSSVTSIGGGSGNDNIWLTGGTISSTGNAVTGGDGNDNIQLQGTAFSGAVLGGAGNDVLGLVTGAAGNIDGGADSDQITLTGSSVASIGGGSGNDNIWLTGGTISSTGNAVTGGDGNDNIHFHGTAFTGAVLGGAGNDVFDLGTGAAGNIDGGADNDVFSLTGSSVAAIVGGSGDDTLTWSAGSVASFNGGDGSDLATVSAAAYDGSQLLDGGDDALTPDTYIDHLTISGKTITTTGSKLVNWERLSLAGGGLTLSDGTIATGDPINATSGLFLTGGAYLRTGAPLTLTGNLSIAAGSRLEQRVSGAHAVTGQLANAGAIDLQNGAASDVLSVGGSYTGGGQLLIDVDGDTADRMTIAGDVLGAPTQISTRLIGEKTTGIPIEVVQVDGATKDGDFTAADFELGAYSYALELDGNTWQFAPTEMLGAGSLYPTMGRLLQQFGRQTIATHFERTGSWARGRVTGEDPVASDGVTTLAGGDRNADGNVWIRAIGQWTEGEGALEGGPANLGKQNLSYDADTGGVQGGVDAVVADTASYLVTVGIFGQTGRLSGNVKNETTRMSSGTAEADAWGLGGSIGFDTENFYVEAVGAWNSYDISTESRSGSADTNGNGYYVSLEAGREFAVSQSIKLVPQAQFAWVNTHIDSFTDGADTKVSFEEQTTPIGRLGLAVDAAAGTYHDMPLRLTGILNYWQDFGDAAQASVGGASLEIDQAGGSIEAGAGFHWGTEQTPLHLHGELTYSDAVSGDGEQSWSGTAGMCIAF